MKKTNSIINAVSEVKADLPKPKRKYTKRTPKAVSVIETPITLAFKEMRAELDRKTQRLNALEQCLVEKEKEVWTLECEVFDKKAVIKYLEEKLFVLGVR